MFVDELKRNPKWFAYEQMRDHEKTKQPRRDYRPGCRHPGAGKHTDSQFFVRPRHHRHTSGSRRGFERAFQAKSDANERTGGTHRQKKEYGYWIDNHA